ARNPESLPDLSPAHFAFAQDIDDHCLMVGDVLVNGLDVFDPLKQALALLATHVPDDIGIASRSILVGDDGDAQTDTFIANVHARPGDQLLNRALVLPAETAGGSG